MNEPPNSEEEWLVRVGRARIAELEQLVARDIRRWEALKLKDQTKGGSMIVMWLALLVGIVAWMVGSVCAFLGLYDACLVNMAMSLLNLGLFAYRFVNKQTK